MALIVRIDVDRPYGRMPLWRHALSRAATDAYFPVIESLGYLRELAQMLQLLHRYGSRAHVFFRQCTTPSQHVLQLLERGGHVAGMHLEDSRSFDTFVKEKTMIERRINRPVSIVSKHGSGGRRYGRRHHAPYEPERYERWFADTGVRYFLGNREAPESAPFRSSHGEVTIFPAAFWLEPAWRDEQRFPIDWLLERGQTDDIVLLLHPENVLANDRLIRELRRVLNALETKVLE